MADEEVIRKFLVEIGYKEDRAARSAAMDNINSLTTSIRFLAKALATVYATDKIIQFNQNLAKTTAEAQRLGTTTVNLERFGKALEIGGGSIEGLKSAVVSFTDFVKQNPAADTWLKGFDPALDITRDKITGLLKDSKGEIVDTTELIRKFIQDLNDNPKYDIALKLNIAKKVGVDNATYFAIINKDVDELYKNLKKVDEALLGNQKHYADVAKEFKKNFDPIVQALSDLYTRTLSKASENLVGPLKEFNDYLKNNASDVVKGVDEIGDAIGRLGGFAINAVKDLTQVVAIIGQLADKNSPAFGKGTVSGPLGALADWLEEGQEKKKAEQEKKKAEGGEKKTESGEKKGLLYFLEELFGIKAAHGRETLEKHDSIVQRNTEALHRLSEKIDTSIVPKYNSQTAVDEVNKHTRAGAGAGEGGSSGTGGGGSSGEGTTPGSSGGTTTPEQGRKPGGYIGQPRSNAPVEHGDTPPASTGETTPFQMPANAPKGLRSNNPFDISLTPKQAAESGAKIVGAPGQPGFAQFNSMDEGFKAGTARINRFIAGGRNTIASMGEKYAEDKSWAAAVSKTSGIPINAPLDTNNANQMRSLYKGILQKEWGGKTGAKVVDNLIGSQLGGGRQGATISQNGKPVPAGVLADAANYLRSGKNSTELQSFMSKQGYPMAGNWCGEFAASVVHASGGTPPKGAALASNWLNWGQHVNPQDVRPGDVAVARNSRYGGPAVPGKTGSHVGLVSALEGQGKFDLLAGNQSAPITSRNMGAFEFRRPLGDNIANNNTNNNQRTNTNSFGPFTTNVHLTPGGNAPSASAIGLGVESGMRRHVAAIRDNIAPMNQ